jgi:hypothetical protein
MLDGIGKVCPMFLKFFVDVNASTATIGIKKEGKWSRNAGRRLTIWKLSGRHLFEAGLLHEIVRKG